MYHLHAPEHTSAHTVKACVAPQKVCYEFELIDTWTQVATKTQPFWSII